MTFEFAWPVIVFLGALFVIFAGQGIVWFVMKILNVSSDLTDQERYVAITIGVCERLVYFVLVCLGQWAALSFVVTARSIVRSQKGNSDYTLLGIFLNLTISILSGVTALAIKVYILGINIPWVEALFK